MLYGGKKKPRARRGPELLHVTTVVVARASGSLAVAWSWTGDRDNKPYHLESICERFCASKSL